jgi:hypothetical protein
MVWAITTKKLGPDVSRSLSVVERVTLIEKILKAGYQIGGDK